MINKKKIIDKIFRDAEFIKFEGSRRIFSKYYPEYYLELMPRKMTKKWLKEFINRYQKSKSEGGI